MQTWSPTLGQFHLRKVTLETDSLIELTPTVPLRHGVSSKLLD